MQFLFVMDPAHAMLPDKDTTFAFIRGAQSRGHECYHCLPTDLSIRSHPNGAKKSVAGAQVAVHCRSVRVSESEPHVHLGTPEDRLVSELDVVFVRKDPPFDTEYLHLTQTLDLITHQTLVVNEPSGLQVANEKLFTLRFCQWMPQTLVSKHREQILAFLEEVGGRAVLKPLDGAGGSGVVALTAGDKNVRALIDLLTQEGRSPAMVQQFQPDIDQGDKRVLLLAGQPLGAILRVPRKDDIRANIHVGGTVAATEVTEEERRLIESVAPTLIEHGLWFVGLDLIGGRLIEVNVTSPTGVQELARLTGEKPEYRVIEWAEAQAAQLPSRHS